MVIEALDQISLKDTIIAIYIISASLLFIWRTYGFILYPKRKIELDDVVFTLFAILCPVFNTYFLIDKASAVFKGEVESDLPEATEREINEVFSSVEKITSVIEKQLNIKIEPDSTLAHYLNIAAMDSFYIGKGYINPQQRTELLFSGSDEKIKEKHKENGGL